MMYNAVVIAGPRDLNVNDIDIRDALHASGFRPIDIIIQGGARGVDTCAYNYAKRHGYIPITVEPRWDYWKQYGDVAQAGRERNGLMAKLRPKGILLMKRKGKETRGTTNMQHHGYDKGIPVFEWRV